MQSPAFTMPALCVRVSSVGALTANVIIPSTGARNVRAQFVDNTTDMPLPQGSLMLHGMRPNYSTLVSTALLNDGTWRIAERNCTLDKSTCDPAALVKPCLQIQVQCPSTTQNVLKFKHLATWEVPMSALVVALQKGGLQMLRQTKDDSMQYALTVTLDTQNMSARQQHSAQQHLQEAFDYVHYHETRMAQQLGMPTLHADELISKVNAFKQARDAACTKVLHVLSPVNEINKLLNLEFSRAYGTQMDSQQIVHLRQGSVLGHGRTQTVWHMTNAQASLLVKIAQEAGVAVCDPLALGAALDTCVRTSGLQQLTHRYVKELQLLYCLKTKYDNDAGFEQGVQIVSSRKDADGCTTMKIRPTVVLSKNPAEDQDQAPGLKIADVCGASGTLGTPGTSGMIQRDCEDGAAFLLAAGADVFRCMTQDQILQTQGEVLDFQAADMQHIRSVFGKLTCHLHQSANEAPRPPCVTDHTSFCTQTLALALEKAGAETPRHVLCATSMLASAPKLGVNFSTRSKDPCASLECRAKEYNEWWTHSLLTGDPADSLNGHSVAIDVALTHALRTSVDAVTVDVHCIHTQTPFRVYESTAYADQIFTADTASVKLDLCKQPVTAMRQNLQQQLNQCGPITMCMANNVKSSLHAAETQQTLLEMNKTSDMSKTPRRALRTALGSAAMPVKVPDIVAVQTFSMSVQADSQPEAKRQLSSKFYNTLLSTCVGNVYSVEFPQPQMRQADALGPAAGAALAAPEGHLYSGMPICRPLQNTPAVVLSSPIAAEEQRCLRALGALQANFVLSARDAANYMPKLTPLTHRMTMQTCVWSQQLLPVHASDLQTQNGCGMLVQTALVQTDALCENEIVAANVNALCTAAQKVVGSAMCVTAGPYVDTAFLTFP